MSDWSGDLIPMKRAGSLPAWWKPADLGSNPSVPTTSHRLIPSSPNPATRARDAMSEGGDDARVVPDEGLPALPREGTVSPSPSMGPPTTLPPPHGWTPA